MWKPGIDWDRLQTGDILEVSSSTDKIPFFIKHYGVVFTKDGKLYVSHSTVTKGPEIESIESFSKNRDLSRYFRDEETELLTDEHIEKKSLEIIDKSKKYNKYKWDFFNYNCEDYVKNICPDCRIGVDHRFATILITSIVVIVIVIVVIRLLRR